MPQFHKLTTFVVLFAVISIHLPTIVAQSPQLDSFTSCDGRVTFDYPSEWTIEEEIVEWQISTPELSRTEMIDAIHLTNEHLTDDSDSSSTQTSHITIEIYPNGPYSAGRVNPLAWFTSVERRSPTTVFGEAEEVIIQERSAARQDFTRTENDQTFEGFQVLIWLPYTNDLLLRAEASDITQLGTLEQTAFELLDTLTFSDIANGSLPQGWSTYFKGNCRFSFNFPADWVVMGLSHQVMVFNSDDAQASHLRRRFDKDDELSIEMISPDEVEGFFMGDIDLDTATGEEILLAYAGLEQLALLSDPQWVEIGEHEALQAAIPNGTLLAIQFDEGKFAIFAARTGGDGFEAFESDVTIIAESIQYQSVEDDANE